MEADNLSLILGYNGALYDDESVARFGGEYKKALEECIEAAEQAISRFHSMTERE